ncbi:MAG: hypothetical protein HN952_01850 [Candidatus Cloacimonetes bacterium]|nr:hypothetical protein [Candidatus Cloacimonadota bacterium]MBT6993676.1 hypothetical protein [Candidatus Cloacimonadota bacterium]MBT7469909.1 hypothetical protein [Candidatus Cloacimonadota bacterium]
MKKKMIIFMVLVSIILIAQTGEKMEELTVEQKMHNYMAIEMNIQTWNLLTKEDRNPQESTKMIYCALASKYHWLKSPYFKPVNEQRAEWLLSRVFCEINNGEKALYYAEKCLELTKINDFKDFDLAYAYEAMARANGVLQNEKELERYYTLAKKSGRKISNEDDKKLFFDDLNSGILKKR